ncbi:SRPBCC family protein [Corallococcus sp. EGB]|uniref:SRPBCC family protein n=1 Tax=Corallococcus sp. EGB TaxID=1521117 RepID=UPI001CBD7768|nr:SRPBCC family protein [Corallococcus sp. EGB]
MWIAGVLGSLVGLIGIVAVVGMALPREHVATRSIVLKQRPGEVWPVVADIAEWPSWNKNLKRVERLADREGRTVYLVEDSNGALPSEVLQVTPPPGAMLVTRIADPDLPFGGTWTWTVAPEGEGCRVSITENGSVSNPVFRFVSRFVMGHHRNMDSYLKELGRRFGEAVQPA